MNYFNSRGSVNQLVTCILTLVTFTGATLTKLEKEKILEEIDSKIERETGGRSVSGNKTYQLTNHYYYNQEDFVNGTVGKDVVDKFKTGLPENRNLPSNITSNFKLKLYGNEYDAITVYASGIVEMKSSGKSFTDVLINLCRSGSSRGYIQLLNTDTFVAIKFPLFDIYSNGRYFIAKLILVMYSDGRLVIIYQDIPTEVDSNELISFIKLYGTLRGHKQLYNNIRVPNSMIKTGVVVQLTPTEKYCSKEKSEQACRDASTKDVVCYWCKDSSVCTSTFDQYTEIWLENNCVIAVMGEDNKGDSSSSTSNLNPTETTKNVFNHFTAVSSKGKQQHSHNHHCSSYMSTGSFNRVSYLVFDEKKTRFVLHLIPAANPFAVITHQYPAVFRSTYLEQPLSYHTTHTVKYRQLIRS
ncbi:plexin domain containing 2 precursor [Schistosoma japonicum]|nr:plexin domain containing 2 precursor [Schistosoma japonicum]